MSQPLQIDGGRGEGGGQVLRTALALSAATGQPFEITRIRANRTRPGLRPQHVAAVRAAALACGARVRGAFDGSPDLRFEPGALEPGEFRFEIATAGAATLVLQTVLAPLARAGGASVVEVSGGTHVPRSPSFHYVERHWIPVVERIGLSARLELLRAGFYPPGGGSVRAVVAAWSQPAPLVMERRGALLEVRGVSGASRTRGDVARRQKQAAEERLWEARRLPSTWDVLEPTAASPGSFLLVEAVFEEGRAAFGFVGRRGIRPESLGDLAGRTLLRFLEGAGAVDPHLADQLATPMALSGRGGRVTTTEVTLHLETVADVLSRFGVKAVVSGQRGGEGALEVAPSGLG